MKIKLRRHLQWWIMLGICLLMVLLNVLARCSHAFSDWYTMYVFLPVSGLWTRLTGLVPFSVGEVLITAGILLLLITPVSLIVLLIVCKGRRRRVLKIYGLVYGWILTWILTTETLHCFIQYQCTPLGEKYFPDAPETYSAEEVLSVYAQLVEGINAVSPYVARDAEGHFLMTDDLQNNAKAAMQRLGETYPQFRGYYPDAKPLRFSWVMAQQSLLGVYFPFTMESNYNALVYPVNLPATLCHEYTHLKGNILEDEANFLSFLACTGSESADFRYSGYLNALEYMMNEVYMLEGAAAIEEQLDPYVWCDLYTFVPEEEMAQIEEEAIVDTVVMEHITDAAMDTTLKLNGVEDGRQSYSRMVNLLLHYYLQNGNAT